MKLTFTTTKELDFDDNITILNPKQAAFYMVEKGIDLIKCIGSRDKNTGEPIVLFVFKKSETQEAYAEWIARR